MFLLLNGYELVVDDAKCAITMLAVAAGEITEAEFAAWIRQYAVKKQVKLNEPYLHLFPLWRCARQGGI